MSKKWLLALGSALIYAPMSLALGLGEINIKSKLNQTLDAEIDITSSTSTELAGLELSIPTADVFARYDLDRPAMLSNVRFVIEDRGNNKKVIRLTSDKPVKDPFLTFLIQADWPQGRMLREYTVLVDPPLYVPAESQAQAYVESAGTSNRETTRSQGAITGRAETSTFASDSSNSDFNYSSFNQNTGDYRVSRGDTLWEIANSVKPDDSLTINQTMMAIFRNNPEAFVGNINRLKAGQILSIPTRNQITEFNVRAANQSVREQTRVWRDNSRDYAGSGTRTAGTGSQAGNSADSGSEDTASVGRLELKVPSVTDTTGLDGEITGELNAENEIRIRELQAKVEEQERLISAKDNELASLQQELGESLAEKEAAAELIELSEGVDSESADNEPAEGEASSLDAETAQEPDSSDVETPLDGSETETEVSAENTETESSTDGETPSESSETPATEMVKEEPPKEAMAAAELPEDNSGLFDLLKKIAIGLGLLLIGVFGFLFARSRKKAPSHDTLFVDEDLDSQVEDIAEAIKTKIGNKYKDTAEVEALKETDVDVDVDESKISIEESGVDFNFGDNAETDAEAQEISQQVQAITQTIESDEALPFDDTTLADVSMGTMDVDSDDPLAETDFHMAYGLYDQAAEIMSSAIIETNNFEFKEKLLEVFFVSGNKEEFMRYASEIKDEALAKHPSSWENVVIMGKQIAPDEQMFSGDVGSASIDEGLDFSLEQSGAVEVDQSLFADLGDPTGDQQQADDDVLDVSMSLGLPDAPVDLEDAIEDFGNDLDASFSSTLTNIGMKANIDDMSPADATQEVSVDEFLDLDIGSPTQITEAPNLDSDDGAIDFDLDLAELGVAGLADEKEQDESDESDETMDFSFDLDGSDDVASKDSDKTQNINEDFLDGVDTSETRTQEMKLDDNFDLLLDGNDETSNSELDLDLDTLLSDGLDPFPDDTKRSMLPDGVNESDSGTMSLKAVSEQNLNAEKIKEVLNPDDLHASTSQITDEELAAMGLSDDGPELMSITGMTLDSDNEVDEISTKLDLARAYIEMDDPENAKGILHEVLEEGSDAQKHEAKSLFDSLK